MTLSWKMTLGMALCASQALVGCRDGSPAPDPVDPGAGIPGVWYVKPLATGDGTSWADAGDLVSVLPQTKSGDEVWIARGTYRPGKEREATFRLVSGVAIYGGFRGDETARTQRDPELNVVVLDGDLLGNDAPGFANRDDNAYHVVSAIDCDANTLLDGLTIEGGAATGDGQGPKAESNDQGAAINIFGGNPVFVGLVIEDNLAANHGAINDHGEGSLYVDCDFRFNRSLGFGGALYLHDHAESTVQDSCFVDNESRLEGGALYIRSIKGALIEDSMFERNRSARGGGTFAAAGARPMIMRCDYTDNRAEIGGGGVFFEFNEGLVSDCVFDGNYAGLEVVGGSAGGGGSGGGGIWTTGGAPTITHCEFRNNLASFGGGVYHIEESAALVEDCLFEDNAATEAGGLYTLASPSIARRCVFKRNRAFGGPFSVGGGMSNYFSDSVLEDSYFESNDAQLGGGGLYAEGEDPIVRSCVFVGNSSKGPQEGWGGGALFGYFTRAQVESCAFVGNRAVQGGAIHAMAFSEPRFVHLSLVSNRGRFGGGFYGGIQNLARMEGCLLANDGDVEIAGTRPTVDSCLVRDETLFQPISKLIEAVPLQGPDLLFGTADDPAFDLTPRMGGPLIDAGVDGALDPVWQLDARGLPRRVNLLGGATATDVGAYERAAP